MNSILENDHYWLYNAQVPQSLFLPHHCPPTATPNTEQLVKVDIHIAEGMIAQIRPSHPANQTKPGWDLQGGQLWCGFVDIHTHLDKGHITDRTPDFERTFSGAIATSVADAQNHWTAEDLYHRMNFALRCSYAHGTQAIRTHLDFRGDDTLTTWEVFQTLQEEWRGKLHLQAVSLSRVEDLITPEGQKWVDRLAEMGGILGAMPTMSSYHHLDSVFQMAQERNLDLDFHTDESLELEARTLYHVAQYALKFQFPGQIICGHCCSLSVQSPPIVKETLAVVKEAGIAIVSLPMCNLYLQDRHLGETPRLRGVTLIQEMRSQGIPVAIASDNCRDPFFAFGDHDGLEVFSQAIRIAQIDTPYGNFPQAIATLPARLMKLPHPVAIAVGLPAHLILFRGRSFSELLSRPQCDRIVLRHGKPIDTTLPDYTELEPFP